MVSSLRRILPVTLSQRGRTIPASETHRVLPAVSLAAALLPPAILGLLLPLTSPAVDDCSGEYRPRMCPFEILQASITAATASTAEPLRILPHGAPLVKPTISHKGEARLGVGQRHLAWKGGRVAQGKEWVVRQRLRQSTNLPPCDRRTVQ
jgi:hypothetical protein